MVGVPSVRQMSCMELAWASSARVATQYALARGLLLAILPLERYLVDDPGVGVDDSWAASRYVYEFWCSGHLQERLYRLRAPVIGLDWTVSWINDRINDLVALVTFPSWTPAKEYGRCARPLN